MDRASVSIHLIHHDVWLDSTSQSFVKGYNTKINVHTNRHLLLVRRVGLLRRSVHSGKTGGRRKGGNAPLHFAICGDSVLPPLVPASSSRTAPTCGRAAARGGPPLSPSPCSECAHEEPGVVCMYVFHVAIMSRSGERLEQRIVQGAIGEAVPAQAEHDH